MLESMRYKDSKSVNKTLWLNESSNWQTVGGYEIPAIGAVTWFDQGKPWAVFTVEDVVFNADVSQVGVMSSGDVGNAAPSTRPWSTPPDDVCQLGHRYQCGIATSRSPAG